MTKSSGDWMSPRPLGEASGSVAWVDPLLGPRLADWWTGLPPWKAPGIGSDGALRALPAPDLATCSREEVLAYFDNGWTLTELLFAGLQGLTAFLQAPYHNLRHPMMFYYGHPAVLYANKLRAAGLLAGPIDAYFEQLFETGVDEMSWDDMSKNEMAWPALEAVQAYRRTVYQQVRELILTHPGLAEGHARIGLESPLWALFMGFEHERIHLETSSVLIRELPIELVRRPEAWVPSASVREDGGAAPVNEMAEVAGGAVVIGKRTDHPSYGWDNEYGQRAAQVAPFLASRQLVSNGEFLAFVAAGGYNTERFWSPEGWRWRGFSNRRHPTFWLPVGPAGYHQYQLRRIFDAVPLPLDHPAEVNFHEAKAYCAWKTEQEHAETPYRLLTEAEHHRLREPGEGTGGPGRWNLALRWGSAVPVDACVPTRAGFSDVFGNVWQWMEDEFHPLDGFAVHPLYEDFSTPCFDGKHQMILGGSFISVGDEASEFARFHFRPHFFQHAGFRLARSIGGDPRGEAVRLSERAQGANPYEETRTLSEYLLLHYGEPAEVMPFAFGPQGATDFPARCAKLLLEQAQALGLSPKSALDIGCAVGRSTFELAAGTERALGVDLSERFIETAKQLAQTGEMPFFRFDEGEVGTQRIARVPADLPRERASFRQADACSLPAELVDFDLVLMANLLCRLPSPRALLSRLAGPRGLVAPGGLLLIVSPYSWLPNFTPKASWLGGYEGEDGPVRAADTLKATLEEAFELKLEAEMPLVIREHARKYQFIVSHALLFQRR